MLDSSDNEKLKSVGYSEPSFLRDMISSDFLKTEKKIRLKFRRKMYN